MKRMAWIGLLLAWGALHGLGSPIAVTMPTTNLGVALGTLDSVAFNGQVRWESASTGNYKLRLAIGASGSPGLVTGGSGITWNTDEPQSFSFSFGGSTATLSVTDGATSYQINANPAETAVNSLLIRIRTNGASTIQLSDLKVDGVSLNISTISLSNVSSESFLFVSNVFAPFTLSGLIRMTRTGGGSGAEIPAMQIYAGYTSVPEPGTFAAVGLGLVTLAMASRRVGNRSQRRPRSQKTKLSTTLSSKQVTSGK